MKTLLAALAFFSFLGNTTLAQPSPDQVTAMAGRGDTQALRTALEAGADPNGFGKSHAINLSSETGPLFEAINGRHVEAVELLLEAGANPFAPDEAGRMPMWYAADAGSVDIARLLLAFDADIEEGSDGGTTPLMWAAYNDHVDLVRFLLDAGADLNARDANNNSVLGKAASPYSDSFGNARTVAFLLERGAELSVPNVYGFTPLHMAVHTTPSSLLLTHMLLEAGADRNARNADGKTAEELADVRGSEALRGYYDGATFPRAQSELFAAVLRADASGVRDAVAAGADPNWGSTINGDEPTEDGGALHEAAAFGHTNLIPVLIDAGADIEAIDARGFTPIYRATENGDLVTVRALLDAGANPQGTDGWSFIGLEPIHYAAKTGNAAVVQALLDAGASADWTTSATMGDGYNALGFAIRGGHLDVVRTLLVAGADPNVLGETMSVPLDLAEERGWTAIAELLREHGGVSGAEADARFIDEQLADGTLPDDLFNEAAALEKLPMLEALLDRGYSPSQDVLGYAGSGEMVRTLLALGLSPNEETSGGTPLFDVVENGSGKAAEVVEALLEAGADPDTPDAIGQSVLHLAVSYEMIDVVATLVDGGAEINATNGDGMTALQIAREYEMSEIIDLLTEAGGSD